MHIGAMFIFILLFAACAQIVAPGGGKPDATPPKVVKYSPDSASLNFKSNSIEIDFDEFVQLRDISSQLIVSPPMEISPDIKVKNKTLSIELDKNEHLKPNTTYVINFGNALQDIHENNPKENFKYIFSTGNFIDSLIVTGKVENAFDHKTEKELLVMLYSDFGDSVIYKKKPDYFAKTKEDGSFQINNVRQGKYKLLALKDANANYKYEGDGESVGFVDALVEPTQSEFVVKKVVDLPKKDSTSNKNSITEPKNIEQELVRKNILIELFQEPAKKLFIKKSIYNSFGKIVFVFNKSADSVKIQPLNFKFNDGDVLLDYSKNKDTLNYWFRNIDKDALNLRIMNGSKILDSVEFKLIKKEDALKNRRSPFKLTLVSSPAGNQGFDLNSTLKLSFNNPITKWNEQPIQFKEDSLVWRKKFKKLSYDVGFQTAELMFLDSTKTIKVQGASLVKSVLTGWKENTPYHLYVLPGTFTDFFGLTNDTLKIDFKTRVEKYYGTLKLKISIPETIGQYIVQLLDEKENVTRENTIKKTEILNYAYLYPQKYKVKIIYDTNSNGKWDEGNLLKKRQPEKVIYDAELINARSNWDSDIEWKIIP